MASFAAMSKLALAWREERFHVKREDHVRCGEIARDSMFAGGAIHLMKMAGDSVGYCTATGTTGRNGTSCDSGAVYWDVVSCAAMEAIVAAPFV